MVIGPRRSLVSQVHSLGNAGTQRWSTTGGRPTTNIGRAGTRELGVPFPQSPSASWAGRPTLARTSSGNSPCFSTSSPSSSAGPPDLQTFQPSGLSWTGASFIEETAGPLTMSTWRCRLGGRLDPSHDVMVGRTKGRTSRDRDQGGFWDSWTIGEEEGLDSHALGHEGDGSRVSRQILGGLGGQYWVRRD